MVRYEIDRGTDPFTGRGVFRVWQVVPGDAENVLLGEYDSLESAKLALSVSWCDPDGPGHEAWAFGEEDLVPGEAIDEEYPPG